MLPKQHLSSTKLASGMPLFTSQLKSCNFQLMTRRMRREASLQIYVYPGGGSCEGGRDSAQKRYCRETWKDEDRDVLMDVSKSHCCPTSVRQPPESDARNTRHFLCLFLLTPDS